MLNRNLTIGFIIVLAISAVLAITVVNKGRNTTNPGQQTPHFASAVLMTDPIPLQRAEAVAQLLPVWRKYRSQKPTFLLLSNNPHLVERPAETEDQLQQLFSRGVPEEIIEVSDRQQANPLFKSESAVDIALRNEWFGRVAWALPILNPAQELNLEKFQQQLVASNSANESEAATFTLEDRFFTGKLRDQQVNAAALPLHQNITGPVIVHIDLSYFQPLYKNEIATPLLKLIHQTLNTLKKMHLKTLAVTFSYGHIDEQIALDVRFIGEMLAYLIEGPTRLDQEIPINWRRQAEVLQLANSFQEEKIRDLYLSQELTDPNSAWIKYNLYKSAFSFEAREQALVYLARAVGIDHLYALEYLDLSDVAIAENRPDEAVQMLTLAAEAFPDNVNIELALKNLTTGDSEQ